MYKLTVITVCFNCDASIESTLISINEQKDRDLIQHVVIDGGSTDNTIDLIKKYQVDKFVSEADYGIYDAMNKGIKLADGKYCIFLNSGDLFSSSTAFSDVLSNFDENDESIFLCKHTVSMKKYKNSNKKHKPISKVCMNYSHQALIYPTAALLRYPFETKYRYAADFDQLLKMSNKIPLIYLDTIISVVSPCGVSDNNRFAVLNEWIEISGHHPIHLYLFLKYLATIFLKSLLKKS